jgi:small-conductance mechanosensitive channel
MEQLIERIQAMLSQREHVDPETIQVIFTDFSDSSLDVLVRCYVDLLDWYDWMKEKEAVNLEVMRIVADLGLSMALAVLYTLRVSLQP